MENLSLVGCLNPKDISARIKTLTLTLFEQFAIIRMLVVGGGCKLNEKVRFMKEALKQAQKAYERLETPVGAVVVQNGKIIARAYNKREKLQDPTAHAEILALKKAAAKIGSWRLIDCDLYVTLEPCAMCAGAIIHSRIGTVFIGAMDPKAGATGSVIDLFKVDKFNHKVEAEFGILEEECSRILKQFFRMLREKKLEDRKRLRAMKDCE